MPSILNYLEFTSIASKHAEKAFFSFSMNIFSCLFHSTSNLHLCYGLREVSSVCHAGINRKTLDISPELQSKFKKSVRGSRLVVKIFDSLMLQIYVIAQKEKQNTSILCSVWGCEAQAALCICVWKIFYKGLNLTREKKRPNLRGKLELNLFLDRHLSESALWFISQSVGRNTNACSKQQRTLPIRPV